MNDPSPPPTDAAPSEDDIRALDHRHVWHPYTQAGSAPPPMVAVGGSGAFIIGDDGRRLLDLVSSWWVTLHGHAHPMIAAAIADQAVTLEQALFADFTHAPAARLAARLAGLLPGDLDRVFYSDNGSTAVEVALKIALQYHANVGDGGRQRLIGFERGYHGDTVGAMSLGRTSGYFRAWDGLLFAVDMVPFPATWIDDTGVADREEQALAALDDALGPDVAGVIIEPLVQGAAGMRVCRPQFLQALAARVRAAGALLIFDEVMTGFGRTGGLFACTGAGVTPDLICLSKGLTGGFLPLAATVAREDIYQAFLGRTLQRAFLHGHSYTANPLGCSAALASLDLLLAPACDRQRAGIEAIHGERLAALADHATLDQRRLCGTIAAVTLTEGPDAALRVKDFFCRGGALIRPLGAHLYFLPPYCIAAADLHRAWDLLEASLTQE